MINEYLQSIIDLDRFIESEKNAVNKSVLETEEDTIKKIDQLEETVLNQTTRKCEREYNEKIERAEKKREEEIEKARKEAEKFTQYYENKKDVAIKLVLDSILKANG